MHQFSEPIPRLSRKISVGCRKDSGETDGQLGRTAMVWTLLSNRGTVRKWERPVLILPKEKEPVRGGGRDKGTQEVGFAEMPNAGFRLKNL